MAFRAGYVALLGKPNVGKSTLVNRFVGQKVSIVSSKPQTTRRRVIGIDHGPDYQIAFIDTPGIHEPHNRLGRSMVEQARGALDEVDVVLVVVDGAHPPGEMDKEIARSLRRPEVERVPRILCLNRMDQLKAEFVVEHVEAFSDLFKPKETMLTTATTGANVDKLRDLIVAELPERLAMYAEDEFTDQPSRFYAAELVREKILIAARQEVPHATAVKVDEYDDSDPALLRITATILVEKASQRAILIGKGGQFVKNVGTQARMELEEALEKPIFLELHVKVVEGWRQNPRILHELEYSDE